ncbi:MAG: thioredoxin domain-containing protein [Bdellovibrionaceae bacterium]|nr:thioredoxin domain-containing protein [Pseudobdellovibrionaceae bacterium]
MANLTKRIGKLYLIQLFCSLAGIGLSLYLLVQHTRLKSGIQDTASVCSINSFLNCDIVEASRFSEILGIPVAGIGAVFFFLLFLLTALASPEHRNFPKTQRLAACLSAAGVAIDLYFVTVQVFILGTLCLFCLGTYLVNILYFVTNSLMCARRGRGLKRFFLEPLKGATTAIQMPAHLWWLSASALFSFIAAVTFLPAVIWMQSSFYSYGKRLADQFFLQWKEKTAYEIPISADDASLGSPDAPIKIVEFSDFECPHCRKAAFTLHTALKPLGSQVQFVFKHYPLDSDCNPELQYQLHPKACKLAKLAECARRKDRFWQYHDRLFLELAGDQGLPAWEKIVSSLSDILSPSEVENCMANPAVLKAVKDNIEAGRKLDLKGTPSVFVNGRLVEIPLTVETLIRLVELES